MRPARRLAAAVLVLLLQAACTGARPPAAPAPAPPAPAPRPASPQPASGPSSEPAGHELSRPVEDGEADALEEETRESLRETEALLDGLDDEARRARKESVATIRGLVEQSRAALAEADLERARNLARKARELAAEL